MEENEDESEASCSIRTRLLLGNSSARGSFIKIWGGEKWFCGLFPNTTDAAELANPCPLGAPFGSGWEGLAVLVWVSVLCWVLGLLGLSFCVGRD
jgi:hypothetical protein